MNPDTITYRLVRTRRKTVALVVEANGTLLVRAPMRLAKTHIDQFVHEHAAWIHERQALVTQRLADNPPHQYKPGELFWYLGERYPLQIVSGGKLALEFKDAFLLDQTALPQAAKVFEAWYRRQARQVLYAKTAAYARLLGLKFARLRLSSARTRWGSCSSRGTLSFSWRLVMAPPAVIDYLVVHELMHLKTPNHSKEYWAQVGAVLPGYKAQAKWLKENGAKLKI